MATRYALGRREGITEELVAALGDYERGPFSDREKAALRYADRLFADHHACAPFAEQRVIHLDARCQAGRGDAAHADLLLLVVHRPSPRPYVPQLGEQRRLRRTEIAALHPLDVANDHRGGQPQRRQGPVDDDHLARALRELFRAGMTV